MRKRIRLGIPAVVAILCAASLPAQYSQPVRDVENPARTPVTFSRSGLFALDTSYLHLAVYTIPAGKRLVMEHIGIVCTMDADDNVSLAEVHVWRASAIGGGTSEPVPILVQKQGTTHDGKVNWVASQPVRLYADAGGGDTEIHVFHSKLTSRPSCSAVISGHTITP